MKKIAIIVPVLICLYLITAGITYVKLEPVDMVAMMDAEIDKIEPQVEYIEKKASGISYPYDIRAYQDGSGYHLYYSNGEDVDATYDLTKVEFLQCTDFTNDIIKELEEIESIKGNDILYDEITIKFKGEDEIVVPPKAYEGRTLMPLYYYADLKTGNYKEIFHLWVGMDLEGKNFPQINEKLYKYYILNKAPYAFFDGRAYKEGVYYPKWLYATHPGSVILSYPGDEYYDIDLRAWLEKSDEELAESGISKIICNGKEAYFQCAASEDALTVFLFFPEEVEKVYLFAPIPENTTKEELQADLIMLLDDNAVKDQRGKIIAIESIAFGIVIVVSIVILVIVNRKVAKRDSK